MQKPLASRRALEGRSRFAARVGPAARLLVIAAAFTAGAAAHRFLDLPVAGAIGGMALSGITLFLTIPLKGSPGAIAAATLFAFFIGAGRHALLRPPPSNEIQDVLNNGSAVVRLRGTVLSSPDIRQAELRSPLQSRPRAARMKFKLQLLSIQTNLDWQPTSGVVEVVAESSTNRIALGDELQLTGSLFELPKPMNPGAIDLRTHYRDEGISAIVRIKGSNAIVIRSKSVSSWSPSLVLAKLRESARNTLDKFLDERQFPIAAAMLLGEARGPYWEQLEQFRQTGVMHILAISGLHLAIFCLIQRGLLRPILFSNRTIALILMGFAVSYAVFTGGRPPIVRAAVLVCIVGGQAFFRRKSDMVNALAVAWISLGLLNPSDLFSPGTHLSFIAVLFLSRVLEPVHTRLTERKSELEQLVEEFRPLWQIVLIRIWNRFLWMFPASLGVWIVTAPLCAACFSLVAPICVLLNPFLIPLVFLAVLSGFFLLLLEPLSPGAATFPGWLLGVSIDLMEFLISIGATLDAHWYCPSPPLWAVTGFYLVAVWLMICKLNQRNWMKQWAAITLSTVLILLIPSIQQASSALRCTFLAVGHGSCAVLELPDGRTFLYDAGSLRGPDVATNQIAHFLWSRGITTIDDVYVSHADLDHYNGLPALMDRFRIDHINLTPSFESRAVPGVEYLKEKFKQQGAVIRTVYAGQTFRAGEVQIQVLHPPKHGPSGAENARSMVLLIRYTGRNLLLTGDLEPPGLEMVMGLPSEEMDVMMAPHHGSVSSNTLAFARWARAKFIVSSEGRPRGNRPDPYTRLGGKIWRTHEHGAITVTIRESEVTAVPFATDEFYSSVAP